MINKKIRILSNNLHSPWLRKMATVLEELGEFAVCSETLLDEDPHIICDLIVVDASGLKMRLIERVIWLRCRYPNVPIVVITASPTWRRARDMIQAGASDYISRSMEDGMLLARCRAFLQTQT